MKKLFIVISVACITLATGLFFSKSEVVLSDLAKDNVEALGGGYCPNGCLNGVFRHKKL